MKIKLSEENENRLLFAGVISLIFFCIAAICLQSMAVNMAGLMWILMWLAYVRKVGRKRNASKKILALCKLCMMIAGAALAVGTVAIYQGWLQP